jgi:hypothetical protein
MLNPISMFPRLVEEEYDRYFFIEVSKEELQAVIGSFKKDKSPIWDGWTTKFLADFFDCVGGDLLGVVEETRCT